MSVKIELQKNVNKILIVGSDNQELINFIETYTCHFKELRVEYCD